MAVATVEQTFNNAVHIHCEAPQPVCHEETEEHRDKCSNFPFIFFSLLISAVYGAMMVLGALYYNDCPNSKFIGLYTVVQGVTVMVNCALFAVWLIFECIPGSVMVTFSTLVFLFNIGWCIIGAKWIFDSESECQDTNLFRYAVGFSFPMWLILLAIFFGWRKIRTVTVTETTWW